MKWTVGALLCAALLAACSTISTPPAAAELPSYAFGALAGVPVQLTVLDQRTGSRDPGWEERVRIDVTKALAAANVPVTPDAPTHVEIRILRAQSEASHHVWNGCVEMTARVTGTSTAEASGAACITKENVWGITTALDVLHLAYEDAMVRVLSGLDAKVTR